jgi:hypothetical protein
MDASQAERLVRINESWWFDELESVVVENRDADESPEVVVKASFYTGIGPTGAQPFSHEFVLDYFDQRWRVLPEEMGTGNDAGVQTKTVAEPPYNEAAGELMVAHSFEELNKLDLGRFRGLKEAIDFDKQKLVARKIVLTSGSMRIIDVAVYQHEGQYLFHYDIKIPPIGTTDIKIKTLYAIVPKDLEDILFVRSKPSERRGKRTQLTTGVL